MDPPLFLNDVYIFILAQIEACLKWQGPYYYLRARVKNQANLAQICLVFGRVIHCQQTLDLLHNL